MGNVMLIPARRQVGNNARKQEEEKPKLRVAAYCRVSTDSDEQATSYEAQVEHYTEYIQKNPDWEFAGIYADDGISGTNTKKREEFNHMIDDCKAGNIDMIITKSISRFARNTLDCLKYIRQLKDMNIPVLFEKESINTMDAKGEVLITIIGISGPAGITILKPEREAGLTIPLPARQGTNQPQSFSWIHEGRGRQPHHRSRTGRNRKAHLSRVFRRTQHG